VSALDKARTAARAELEGWTGGDPNPDWRACYSTDGTDGPTGVGPVCHAEEHDPDDGSVYDCCPAPVIEVESTPLAEYLAALLNADRGSVEGKGTGTTSGEPTQPRRRTDAERRHWLLSVVISERGQWTVGRVKRLYGRYHEGHVLRSTIRRELAALHAAGELVMHDGSDRRYYTLAPGGAR